MNNRQIPPHSPNELRWGGPRYKDDEVYRESALQNVRMLEQKCGISNNSQLLDVDCGSARLLTGLIDHFGAVERYVGIDVYEPAITWLNTEIAPLISFADFHRIDFPNERYNAQGSNRQLKLSLGEFDCINLILVFSHMLLKDIGVYLPFLKSQLAPKGKIFLTVFVEDGVELECENPKNYHREWQGKLHCVRLNRQEFERRVSDASLQVHQFEYRHTNDGQSSYILSKPSTFVANVVTR